MTETSTSTSPALASFLKPSFPSVRSAMSVMAKEPTYRAAAFNPFMEDDTPIRSRKIAKSGKSSPWLTPAATITVSKIM